MGKKMARKTATRIGVSTLPFGAAQVVQSSALVVLPPLAYRPLKLDSVEAVFVLCELHPPRIGEHSVTLCSPSQSWMSTSVVCATPEFTGTALVLQRRADDTSQAKVR